MLFVFLNGNAWENHLTCADLLIWNVSMYRKLPEVRNMWNYFEVDVLINWFRIVFFLVTMLEIEKVRAEHVDLLIFQSNIASHWVTVPFLQQTRWLWERYLWNWKVWEGSSQDGVRAWFGIRTFFSASVWKFAKTRMTLTWRSSQNSASFAIDLDRSAGSSPGLSIRTLWNIFWYHSWGFFSLQLQFFANRLGEISEAF